MAATLELTLNRLAALMARGTPSRGVILALLTLLVLTIVHRVSRGKLAAYFAVQAQKPENAARFLRGYDVAWKFVKGCLVLIAASGSFRWLGLTVGFLTTMLGWSLQVPIRGLAAWVMVVLRRPFRLGDRITVAGVTGDVIDVQLNHIILHQVGGTVQGEESSGRGILVPNAMLFGESIQNYNYFGKQAESTGEKVSRFILDEVLVRITFGSDQEAARALCIQAAEQATREILGEATRAPFCRAEFLAWGVLLRVRYETIAARRPEVSSRVTELIWHAVTKHADQVRFAFPGHVTRVVRAAEEPLPPMVDMSGQKGLRTAP